MVSSGRLAVLVAVYACVCQCMFVSPCSRKVSKMLTSEEQRENAAANMTNLMLLWVTLTGHVAGTLRFTCQTENVPAWGECSSLILCSSFTYNPIHACCTDLQPAPLTTSIWAPGSTKEDGPNAKTKFLCALCIGLSFLTFTPPLPSSTAAPWFKNHSPANQCTKQQQWCKHTLWSHWSFYVS